MKIFLRDHRISDQETFRTWIPGPHRQEAGSEPPSWRIALEHNEAFGPALLGNARSANLRKVEETELETDQVIVFLHCPDEDLRELWFAQFKDEQRSFKGVLVLVSTQVRFRQKQIPAGMSRVFACWWTSADFARPDRAEVREFIHSVKEGRPRFELLQPRDKSDSPDLLPALAVLCQGFLLAMNPESNLPDVNRGKVQKEVQTPTWWKQPFREFSDAPQFSAELESEWGGEIPASVKHLVAEIFRGRTIAGAMVEEAARALAGRLGY